ncbi:MAG: hypothetical protein IIB26_02830 [Chloroflexi bacterium]|nr:hypothetical protein [Chloroflexota bacterium]
MRRCFTMGLLPLLTAAAIIGAVACGSGSNGGSAGIGGEPLSAADIVIATATASAASLAPTGMGGLTAIEVLQKAAEASASLVSFRFTTEMAVTAGEELQVSTVDGEWSLPGRYRGATDDPDDPIAEFIVADGQLIYRERGSDVWRRELEFDPDSNIGSGQIIPRMEIFEFSDPSAPDDGEFYRITGSENIRVPGIDAPIVQTHELAIRVSDFHVEYVISFINRDPDIGIEGTRRAFVVYDRNVPDRIEIPATVLPPGG